MKKRLLLILLFTFALLTNSQSIYADDTLSKTIHLYVQETESYTVKVPNSFTYEGDTAYYALMLKGSGGVRFEVPETLILANEESHVLNCQLTKEIVTNLSEEYTSKSKTGILLTSEEYMEESCPIHIPITISYEGGEE